MILTKIDWAPSETLFKIGSFGLHYYSLMFVIAFGLGYYLMKKIFDEEKIAIEHLESLFGMEFRSKSIKKTSKRMTHFM